MIGFLRILAKPFTWFWFTATFQTKAVIVGIILVLFGTVFVWRSCSSRRAKIDLQNIEKVNSQNRQERQAELQKVIEQNADVVKTVDDRTTIADANVEQRNAQIYAKIKDADEKIEAAKQQGRDVTSDELECILVPEHCK